MLFNAEDMILRSATNIGNIRLSPGDDPVVISGKIIWVSSTDTGKQMNQLIINIDDISESVECEKKENAYYV